VGCARSLAVDCASKGPSADDVRYEVGQGVKMAQPRGDSARREREARSPDLVQRVIVSGLVAIVFGTFSAVLAAYLVIRGDQDLPPISVIGHGS
jgi:hypothetical protein